MSAFQHFGLLESPFAASPDPRFLFNSESNAAALDHISRAIQRREAVVVITGQAGTGKTLLCQQLREQRVDDRIVVSIVEHGALDCDELIRRMLRDFGAQAAHAGPDGFSDLTGHELVRTLRRFLDSLAPLHSRAVIVIDEAEHLQPAVLERLRLLSHFETDSEKLLQIVLVGRPSVDSLLDAAELRQLKQRISRRYHLQTLAANEVGPYIERRLWVAQGGAHALFGSEQKPFWRLRFTRAGIRAVAMLSGGVPRAINAICDRALDVAAARERTRIDAATVLSAAQRRGLPAPLRLKIESRRSMAAAAMVGLATVGIVTASLNRDPGDTGDGTSAAATIAGTLLPAAGVAEPIVAPLVEAETFAVVAASFRSAERARALAVQVAGLGLPAFTRPAPGSLFQVVVGPYASRDEARAAQRQLGTLQVSDTEIIATAPGAG